MSALSIDISIDGLATTAERVQRLRNAVANRGPLHAHLAVFGREKLRADVAAIEQHKSANRLGAKPTNHLQKTATRIEGQSDAQMARLLIPRASRLRAAFGTYTVTPGPGKKWLTRPAHSTTYGKRAPEIRESMEFALVGGRHPALKFTSGPHEGDIAYWLMKSVTIEEDKTLIPFDLLRDDLSDEAIDYLDEVANGTEGLA